MITEETAWGMLTVLWIGLVSIPYFVQTSLLEGRNDKSKKIVDGLLLPWVLGFWGLLGLWYSDLVYAWVGYAYSLVAFLIWVGFVVWRKQRLKNEFRNSKENENAIAQLGAPSKMLLSNAQRCILIVISAIIALMLYMQIDEVGMDESPWLLGLVVIAALLLLAFAPRKI